MHHQIHEGEADHGRIKVVAVEVLLQDVFIVLREQPADATANETVVVGSEDLACGGPLSRELGNDVLVRVQQEAGSTAGRITDAVTKLRVHQFADELDNVTRSAELPVLSGGADFAEQHFIDVALNVLKQVAFLAAFAINFEKDFLDDGDRALQKVGAGDEEDGVRHVPGERAAFAVEIFDEWEDLLLDVGQHKLCLHFLDVAPSQGGFVDRVFLLNVVGQKVFTREAGNEGIARERGVVLALGIQIIEPLHEQQVSDLLDGGERIGDAAGPESVPELVDECFEFCVEL